MSAYVKSIINTINEVIHEKYDRFIYLFKVSVNSEKKLLLDIVSEISIIMLCESCYFG